MHLSTAFWAACSSCWLTSALVIPSETTVVRRRNSDFESVKTRLTKDRSYRPTNQVGKYFHESVSVTFQPAILLTADLIRFDNHYDGRFADKTLRYKAQGEALSALMQSYLSTMAGIGAETWLMHGTLIGWWWNNKILPWDNDIDVMVSQASMDHLAQYYNLTVHTHQATPESEERQYMLEINAHYNDANTNSPVDQLNKIDGRWVDMNTGLYIDITMLHLTASAENHDDDVMTSKDGHLYRYSDIFPLKAGSFEGSPCNIPNAYEKILKEEYGNDVLEQMDFKDHVFDRYANAWKPLKDPNAQPNARRVMLQKAARGPQLQN